MSILDRFLLPPRVPIESEATSLNSATPTRRILPLALGHNPTASSLGAVGLQPRAFFFFVPWHSLAQKEFNMMLKMTREWHEGFQRKP